MSSEPKLDGAFGPELTPSGRKLVAFAAVHGPVTCKLIWCHPPTPNHNSTNPTYLQTHVSDIGRTAAVLRFSCPMRKVTICDGRHSHEHYPHAHAMLRGKNASDPV
jgi:hypothetical protein